MRVACKLEFQASSTPQHHMPVFLEVSVLENGDEIDAMISAELPSENSDPLLRRLVDSLRCIDTPRIVVEKLGMKRVGLDTMKIL